MKKASLLMIAFGSGSLVALVLLMWAGGLETAPASVSPAGQVASNAPARFSMDYAGEGNLIPTWSEPGFIQGYTAEDFRDVYLEEYTLDAVTGQWEAASYYGSSTFDIALIASSGRDYFYVMGIDSAQRLVFERWRLKAPNVQIPGAPPQPKKLKRVELYRGALSADVRALEIDPERRFALAVLVTPGTGELALYLFSCVPGGAPTLLHSEATLPELAHVNNLARLDHASLGRIWILHQSEDELVPRVVVLVDANNDGVFDGPPIIEQDDVAYDEGGLLHVSEWVNDFTGL